MLGAGVVLRDPAGNCLPIVTMRELAEGSDRFGAHVTPTSEGLWHFSVEAWGDPIAHWRHDAAIKVPIGQDVDLMLTEGALLFGRAAGEAARGAGQAARGAGQAARGAGQAARGAGQAARGAGRAVAETSQAAGDPGRGVTAASARALYEKVAATLRGGAA